MAANPPSTRSEFPSIGVGADEPSQIPTVYALDFVGVPTSVPALVAADAWDTGSIVINKHDGAIYHNIGTAAAPAWALISSESVLEFTFAPGSGSIGPRVFDNWTDLYNVYSAVVNAEPEAQVEISVDDSLAPAVVTQVAGVPVQTFSSRTTFKGSRADSGPQQPDFSYSDQATLLIAPGVEATIDDLPSQPGTARLKVKNLKIEAQDGRAAPVFTIRPSSRLLMTMSRAQIVNKDTLGNYFVYLADNDLDLEIDNSLLGSTVFASTDSPIIGWGDAIAVGTYKLDAKGRTKLQPNVIESVLTLVDLVTKAEDPTQLGEQTTLRIPDARAFRAPQANANRDVVTSFGTLVSAAQLAVAGTELRVNQAIGFGLGVVQPLDGDTLNITDGVNTVALTYRGVKVNPTDIQIGGTLRATLLNTATEVNANGLGIWGATVEESPQSGRGAVFIYRLNQANERYNDRIYGISQGGNARVVGFTIDGIVPQHYSEESVTLLPAADPGISAAGFGIPSGAGLNGVRAGQPAYVFGGNSAGIYVAEPAIGAGVPSWRYVASPLTNLLIPASTGNTALNRDERAVQVAVGAADTRNILLSPYVEPGEPVIVVRVDNTAGTVTLTAPAGQTINGLPSIQIFQRSGLVVFPDLNGNYWTAGAYNPYDSLILGAVPGNIVLLENQSAVEVTLAGGIVTNLVLNPAYPEGVPLMVRREDNNGASTLNIDPGLNTINAVAGLSPVPTKTTVLLMRLSTGNWILL